MCRFWILVDIEKPAFSNILVAHPITKFKKSESKRKIQVQRFNQFLVSVMTVFYCFRLWLISEATPNFSFVLAQNSLKIVYETPRGLKNNILRTYLTYGSKFIEKLNPNAARIFFVIACMHALLQERRKYIPQGT